MDSLKVYEMQGGEPKWTVLTSWLERWRGLHGWPTEFDPSDVIKFTDYLLTNLIDFQAELAELEKRLCPACQQSMGAHNPEQLISCAEKQIESEGKGNHAPQP